jgi:predicted transglutaminase-like cysteine proteinase
MARVTARYGRGLILAGLLWPAAQGAETEARLDKIARDAASQYGPRGGQAVRAWLDALRRAADLPELGKLKAMNDFWNHRLVSRDDMEIWRRADYWATPIESLGKGAGDCEDYAIGKYFSLLALGVDPHKLRLIYAGLEAGGAQGKQGAPGHSPSPGAQGKHMVLGYYPSPGATPLVLDNLAPALIVKASERRDLRPLFSFNASGKFVGGGAWLIPISKDEVWNGLIRRMRRDGSILEPEYFQEPSLAPDMYQAHARITPMLVASALLD